MPLAAGRSELMSVRPGSGLQPLSHQLGAPFQPVVEIGTPERVWLLRLRLAPAGAHVLRREHENVEADTGRRAWPQAQRSTSSVEGAGPAAPRELLNWPGIGLPPKKGLEPIEEPTPVDISGFFVE